MRRCLALIALLPVAASAQSVVGGIARDRQSGRPLACMEVTLADAARPVGHTWTRRDGSFEFPSPPQGVYSFQFKAAGFQLVKSDSVALDSASDLERDFLVDLLVEDSLTAQRRDTADRSVPRPIPLGSRGGWRYPERLRRRAIYSGNVLVAHAVDERGRVDTATVINVFASEPEFFTTARDMLRVSRFRPAERGGGPVCMLTAAALTFGTSAFRVREVP